MKLVIIFILSFMTFSMAIAQNATSKCENCLASATSYLLTEVQENGLASNDGVRFINFKKFSFVVSYQEDKTVKVFWKGKESFNRIFAISKVKFYPMLKGDKRSKETIIFTTGEELNIWYNQDGTVSGYHFIHYKWAAVSGQTETEEGITSNN